MKNLLVVADLQVFFIIPLCKLQRKRYNNREISSIIGECIVEKIAFRSAVAVELAGVPKMDYYKIRQLTGRDSESVRSARADYTPDDVRTLKRALIDGFAAWQDSDKHVPLVAIRMSKGGVGKSTISTNMAIATAMRGYRVLVIDLDPQASTTELFGVDSESDVRTVVSGVLEGHPLKDCVYSMSNEAVLHLMPADQLVAHFDPKVVAVAHREHLLEKFLERNREYIKANYDIIFLDTAPGSSFLNLNALVACDLVVAPMSMDGMSQKALKLLRTEIMELKDWLGVDRQVLFVANNYNKSQTHSRQNLEAMQLGFGDYLAKAVIPANVSVARQISGGIARPVILSEPNRPASLAIHQLTRQILRTVGMFGVDPDPVDEEADE
ncbi:ParA family protein [Chitinilyticum piscinae]|uniref:ParA family protein n=1 Tax=Chitinilyticum piscinae TaxID=2866724 RepID=A0A8J7K2S0_9NEIS|nr:ParA family protein [Chitinilyticum piscinae]MBE9610871.1 ParA family protein [Chitinilyticum piscinae]